MNFFRYICDFFRQKHSKVAFQHQAQRYFALISNGVVKMVVTDTSNSFRDGEDFHGHVVKDVTPMFKKPKQGDFFKNGKWSYNNH